MGALVILKSGKKEKKVKGDYLRRKVPLVTLKLSNEEKIFRKSVPPSPLPCLFKKSLLFF